MCSMKQDRPILIGCKWGYLFFMERDWSQECCHGNIEHSRCHSVSFVMHISGAKFEEHCSNISGDILDSVFTV